MRTALYIIAFVILSIAVAFTIRVTNFDEKVVSKKEKKADKTEKNSLPADRSVRILEQYDLPDVLLEVSGLAYLDQNRFACVQDELGKIFIYNTSSKKIEAEIDFGPAGDYEGLAVAGETAYVLRSDGQITEVKNYRSAKPATQIYNTPLTEKHNTEGLCYDAQHNRLLIAIKGNEPGNKDYKGIYSFDLKSKKMQDEPAYKIDLNSDALAEFKPQKSKKAGKQIQPSGIAIHPQTNDLYITEGANPKLMVMDRSGKIKAVKVLDKKQFYQPEGITFSPDGRLFIANEGKKEPGNIMELNKPELQ